MTFTNKPILLNQEIEIPSHSMLSFEPLEKKFLLVKRISFTVSYSIFILLLVAAFYWIEELQNLWLIVMAVNLCLLWGIFYWVTDDLSFRVSGYALREQDLHYKTGWWIRKTRIISFNRVQHLSVEASLLERRYGLASVAIYTAGAAQADFKVRGLSVEAARELKELINEKVNGTSKPIETSE